MSSDSVLSQVVFFSPQPHSYYLLASFLSLGFVRLKAATFLPLNKHLNINSNSCDISICVEAKAKKNCF